MKLLKATTPYTVSRPIIARNASITEYLNVDRWLVGWLAVQNVCTVPLDHCTVDMMIHIVSNGMACGTVILVVRRVPVSSLPFVGKAELRALHWSEGAWIACSSVECTGTIAVLKVTVCCLSTLSL